MLIIRFIFQRSISHYDIGDPLPNLQLIKGSYTNNIIMMMLLENVFRCIRCILLGIKDSMFGIIPVYQLLRRYARAVKIIILEEMHGSK